MLNWRNFYSWEFQPKKVGTIQSRSNSGGMVMIVCDKCKNESHIKEKPHMLSLLYEYLDFQHDRSSPDLCFNCAATLHDVVNKAIDEFLGRKKPCE